MLRNNESTRAIQKKFPHLLFVRFKSGLYDLTDFLHSGGNYIIREVVGRGVERFIYGAYGLENYDMKPNTHTAFALKALEDRYIGPLTCEASPLILSEEKTFSSKNEDEEGNCVFKIVEKCIYAETGTKYRFKPLNDKKIANFLPGTKWIGSFFLLSPFKGKLKKTRLYTVVFCLHPKNESTRNDLLKLLETKEENIIPELNKKRDHDLENTLTLVMKTYHGSNTLSYFLQSSEHLEYTIQGPFGEGLGINTDSNNTFVIYAGGTGVLPFLDLFDYLLRKVVHKVLAEKFHEKAERCNPFHENYKDSFGDNFKVYLFAAFENEEEFYGKEIILPLFHISKKYDIDIFNLVVRYRSLASAVEYPTMKDSFSYDSTFKLIKDSGSIEKVFVCGPPKMNSQIPRDLKAKGFDVNKIVLV